MAVLVGCSGYNYEDWRTILYPADLARDDFLRYYSLFFPTVELDYANSAPPLPWQLENLAAMTPLSFRFIVRAPRSLTRDIPANWRTMANAFAGAVRVRLFRQRLGAVVLPVSRRFRHTDPNRVYLGELTEEWSDLPLFLEFRGEEWLSPSVMESADKRGFGVAASDDIMAARPETCHLPNAGGRSLLRMRGRLVEGGKSGGSYGVYAYSDYELSTWKDAVLSSGASECYVLFNNFGEGNAVKDARRFQALLDAAKGKLAGIAQTDDPL